jgi:excisionase family DNA binding protein
MNDDATDAARDVLTIPEAARRLGISQHTAYKMASDGTLPSIRMGGRVLVPRLAFEEMLALGQRRMGIYTLRRFTAEEDKIITDDYAAYVMTRVTAEKLGRDVGTVRQRIFALGLRRSAIVTRAMQWAPEHLRAQLDAMAPEEWVQACYAWRDQQHEIAKTAGAAEAERIQVEQAQVAAEIQQRDDLSRNDKIKAMRMAGLTLEQIGATYGIERVRQISDPNYRPLPAKAYTPQDKLAKLEERQQREREQIMQQAAQRLLDVWNVTPEEARTEFLAMIKDVVDDE